MYAVEFCRNLHRQAAATQSLSRIFRVLRRGKKVAAQREEHFRTSIMHRLDCFDRVEAVLTRRLEIKFSSELVEKGFSGSFPNSHSAIALHITMAAHRTKAGAWVADLPTQQHQVNDLLDIGHGVLVLGQT